MSNIQSEEKNIMNHNTIQKHLLSYLDGELSPEEAVEVRHHLLKCERCRSLTELWKEERSRTRRLSPPPSLWPRIQSELQQSPLGWVKRLKVSIRPVMQPAAVMMVFIFMVFAGIRIGEGLVDGQQQEGTWIDQEFRMSYFTVVPSGSIGEELVTFETKEREISP